MVNNTIQMFRELKITRQWGECNCIFVTMVYFLPDSSKMWVFYSHYHGRGNSIWRLSKGCSVVQYEMFT